MEFLDLFKYESCNKKSFKLGFNIKTKSTSTENLTNSRFTYNKENILMPKLVQNILYDKNDHHNFKTIFFKSPCLHVYFLKDLLLKLSSNKDNNINNISVLYDLNKFKIKLSYNTMSKMNKNKVKESNNDSNSNIEDFEHNSKGLSVNMKYNINKGNNIVINKTDKIISIKGDFYNNYIFLSSETLNKSLSLVSKNTLLSKINLENNKKNQKSNRNMIGIQTLSNKKTSVSDYLNIHAGLNFEENSYIISEYFVLLSFVQKDHFKNNLIFHRKINKKSCPIKSLYSLNYKHNQYDLSYIIKGINNNLFSIKYNFEQLGSVEFILEINSKKIGRFGFKLDII